VIDCILSRPQGELPKNLWNGHPVFQLHFLELMAAKC